MMNSSKDKYININTYKKYEKIYQSNLTKIYQVCNVKSNKLYAAKVLSIKISQLARTKVIDFYQEVSISLRLNHPSIIKFIGYSPTDFKGRSNPALIYEFGANQSLDKLFELRRNIKCKIDFNDTKKLINIYGIASAMAYLHTNNIIHCNLQPNNILLDDSFYPKICDFGSSKDLTKKIQLNDSEMKGSALYIAPEIYLNSIYSKAGDVYSFSFIVYEIITETKPFNNLTNNIDIFNTTYINKKRPDIPKTVPICYRQLIEKCWSHEPKDRPSFSEILSELKCNKDFITAKINKEEYNKYIKMTDCSKCIFEKEVKIQQLEDDIESKTNQFLSKKIQFYLNNNVNLNFNIRKYNPQNQTVKGFYKFAEIKDNVIFGKCIVKSPIYEIKDFSRREIIAFCNEINILVKLNHISILKTVGYSPFDYIGKPIPSIIMKNCERNTLDYLQKYENMYEEFHQWNETKKLIFIYGIAAGMNYLHSNNILHRDLNPKNLTYDDFRSPKISGFHLAIEIPNEARESKKVKVKDIKGTAAYLAPEIYTKREYSDKSDVYSYSLILYEIFTKHKPFEQFTNPTEIKKEICDNKYRPIFPIMIPTSYRQLIEKCWSQNPKNRPTFSEILTELKTNEGFITYQVDKNEYHRYIEFIDHYSGSFYSRNMIPKLTEILSSQIEDYPDISIDLNLKGIFDTEMNNISFNPIYINPKNYVYTKDIYKGSSYLISEIREKSTDSKYAAKQLYLSIDELYQHQFVNFLNELNVLVQLDHPCILKFIGFSPINLHNSLVPLIITEYAPSKILRIIQNFDGTKALKIIYGIAAGMNYLHSNNILHRDLKPNNIYIDDSFLPKISGFNLAMEIPNEVRESKKVKVKDIKGTAAYLAPEIYTKREYSDKSDVYSYSLILYEIFTKHKPFEQFTNPTEIKKEICDNKYRPILPTTIPPSYCQLIEKCWSQNPKKRPTFSEILTELKTNKGFITDKVDKNEYYKYIDLVDKATSSFKSENKIQNLYEYILFHLKRHPKFENLLDMNGIYQTETNCIVFKNGVMNLKNIMRKKLINSDKYYNTYKFTNTENEHRYTGRTPIKKIERCSYSHLNLFSKEIVTYSKLSHRAINIFKGYSMVDLANQPYPIIFSEYTQNGSLYDLLEAHRENHPIKEWDNTKQLICIYGIASAMKYLHENNIVHRYLTPKNILIDKFLFPKVSYIVKTDDESTITDSFILESSDYRDATIESISGLNKENDVFTFGLILYEIWVKVLPKRFVTILTGEKIVELLRTKKNLYTILPPLLLKIIRICDVDCTYKCEKIATFAEIVDLLKTDEVFVETNVNKSEYLKYIEYIDNKIANPNEEFTKYKIKYPRLDKQLDFLVKLNNIDLSRYEMQEQIGKGTFGSAYKVVDKTTGYVYAAKVSNEERDDIENDSIRDLSREIEIISQLNHPAILKFIGYNSCDFESQPKPTIITELAVNGSLDKVIELEKENRGIIDWDDTKKLINIYGIAVGLRYLHKREIIHRDLKPANIFLDENYYPKIGDFGLSRDYEAHAFRFDIDSNQEEQRNPVNLSYEKDIIPKNSGYKGTFAYSSPEIFRNNEYSFSSDVYAYGMIVYEIMTNEMIFEGMNRFQLMKEVLNGIKVEFKYPIPLCYKRLIEKCLLEDPDRRPTFETIVAKIEDNPNFITENVDKEEFYNYISLVKQEIYNPALIDSRKIKAKDKNKVKSKSKTKDKEIDKLFLNLEKYKKISDISEGDFYKNFKIQEIKTGKFYEAKEYIMQIDRLTRNEIINLSREVNIVSKINHPSFLKFIGFSLYNFKKESKPVIVTELSPKGSLDIIVKNIRRGHKVKDWNDTKKLINIYGIAVGMLYLHSNNILHRNLKTENIYLDVKMYPKIGDFGLSTKCFNVDSISFQSTSGFKGTPCYSSPETLQFNEYSKPSDVYSFAFIVYEIMTNEIPFKNLSMNQIFIEVVENRSRPEFYESIPDCYQRLIEKCWDQDPKERPTFEQIVNFLRTQKEFITENVNKKEFNTYIKFIDKYHASFDSTKKIHLFDELIKNKSKIVEDNKISEFDD